MLLWMESWDIYGTDETLLLDGLYAETNGLAISTANPRTGIHQARITASNEGGFRRVFGGDLDAVGIGYAFYLAALPSNSDSVFFAEFRDVDNVGQCGVRCTSDGRVRAYRGSHQTGTYVDLGDSDVVVGAAGYNHIEIFAVLSATVGSIEVRINSVTVLNLTGVNNQGQAGTHIAQVLVGASRTTITGFPAYMDVDDVFAWDTSGAFNNDFVGDKKVYTLWPDADTAAEDWTPATGTDSFEMVNNSPPDDGAAYLESVTDGDVSAFTYTDLPAEVVSIAAIQAVQRSWKTDAGQAITRASVVSGVALAAGQDVSVSQVPTFYPDVFEYDPATAIPWTPSGVNGVEGQIERIAPGSP